MAAQADSTAGFYEEVTHAQTPDVFGRGARYAVAGAGDLRVVAGGAGDRAVTVAPGTAWGDAVLANWTSGGAVLNAAANGGGPRRWDTVAIRRDWTTETATLMIAQGGSAEALAPGIVLRNPSPGVGAGYTFADQPIALVPVDPGSAVINTAGIRDLRVWSGEGGGLVGGHAKARDYITSVGTTLRVGQMLYTRMLDLGGNPYWDEYELYSPTRGPRPVLRRSRSTPVGKAAGVGYFLNGGMTTDTAGDIAPHIEFATSASYQVGEQYTLNTAGVYAIVAEASVLTNGGAGEVELSMDLLAGSLVGTPRPRLYGAANALLRPTVSFERYFRAGTKFRFELDTSAGCSIRDWSVAIMRESD